MDDPPHLKHWFVFGVYSQTGFVDISDGETDVIMDVSPVFAAAIIEARSATIKRILAITGEEER